MTRACLLPFVVILLAGNALAQSPGPFGFGLTTCQHDNDTYNANREELIRVYFEENGIRVVNAVNQLYPDAEELWERFSDTRPEVAQLFADVVRVKEAIPGVQIKLSLEEGKTLEDLVWDIYNKQPTSDEIKKLAAEKGKQEGRQTLVRFLTIAQSEGKQSVRAGWLGQDEQALQDQVKADSVEIIGPDGKALDATIVQLAIVIEHHWEVDVASGQGLDNRIKLAVGGAYTTAADAADNTSEQGTDATEAAPAEQTPILHQLLYQRQWTPMFRP